MGKLVVGTFRKAGDHSLLLSERSSKQAISASDIYLFHEGTLYRSYFTFGAHRAVEDGRTGVRFTVWAPHAIRVGLASDWNEWSGQNDLLYKIPDSGIWTRFFPGVEEGTFTSMK